MSRFVTDTGVEVASVSEAQMRELDRIAIEETGPNLFQMMENAGRALAELALERLGASWRAASVLVLAGPGGNGGGGLCAARHLANRGLRVRVSLAEPDRMREVPAFQRRVLGGTSAEEVPIDRLGTPDLVLDALLGYSLRGPPHGATAQLIEWTGGIGVPILALDVPSGKRFGMTPSSSQARKPASRLTGGGGGAGRESAGRRGSSGGGRGGEGRPRGCRGRPGTGLRMQPRPAARRGRTWGAPA